MGKPSNAKALTAMARRKKDRKEKHWHSRTLWIGIGGALLLIVLGAFLPASLIAEEGAPSDSGSPRLPRTTSGFSCALGGQTMRSIEGKLKEGGWRGGFQDLRKLLAQCSADENAAELHEGILSMLERSKRDVSDWELGEWSEGAATELRVIEHLYKKVGDSVLAHRFLKAAAKINPFDMNVRGAAAASAPTVTEKIELYKDMLEDLEYWEEGDRKRELSCMVFHNLGLAYHLTVNNHTLAMRYYEKSIEQDPTSSSVVNLATIKREMGFCREASELIAASIPPWTLNKHQNLINSELYIAPEGSDRLSASRRMEEVRSITHVLQASMDAHLPSQHLKVNADCKADRERPLFVSFVSSSIVLHRAFLEPVLRDYDRTRLHVEVFTKFPSKGQFLGGDDVLDSILDIPDVIWHEMEGLTTQEIINDVLAAPTDILIEMGRHTSGNALRMVSQIKPTPVALTWVGGAMVTSGVKAMDGIICDKHHCPEGVGIERYFTEKIYRMPYTYAPFAPDTHFGELPIHDSPMVANGYVTFGSKNKLAKVNADTVRLWASVLKRVPTARMLIQSSTLTREAEERLSALFEENKIKLNRIIFQGTLQKKQWLESFNDIDILLDTWPYCGGLTTLHALYMGTPVVTLCQEAGPYWGCHSSAYVKTLMEDGSLVDKLSNKNYDSSPQWNWAATDDREYINTAVALATQDGIYGKGGVRVRHQRAAIRDALLTSPIVTPEFTRDFERLLSDIWADTVCPPGP